MKMLIGLLSLIISFHVMASNGETRTVVYNGSQDNLELLLRGEETHTEYRYEQRASTCSRTVIAGHRTVCSGGGPRNPRMCRSYPVYRTVYYPCTITVQIPYEVKDYDVEATVSLNVAKLPEAQTSGETFKIGLNGPELTFDVVGSKKFFLVLKDKSIRTEINGNVKYITANYSVELVEASPILSAFNMSSITFEDGILKVAMGPVRSLENLGFSLSVAHKRIFGSGPVIFDRELTTSEVQFTDTHALINIEGLGVDLSGGKFILTTRAFFKHAGDLLNASQFGELEDSRTLIYTNR